MTMVSTTHVYFTMDLSPTCRSQNIKGLYGMSSQSLMGLSPKGRSQNIKGLYDMSSQSLMGLSPKGRS